MFYEQANNVIIEKLRSANALIHFTTISHAAAHDWRTKKPVIYRATLQWFIDIKNIQKPILLALKKIKFINKTHREHLVDMIKHRSE
jgi:isoleucyl-tRNA synthetase